MKSKFFHYAGIFSLIAIFIVCFLPWTYYRDINTMFTGFNVTPFATGNYYGKAGYPISVLAGLILILFLIPKLWAKRVCIFTAALLLAYCIRTFIIFTSGLVKGDVVKQPGIFLMLLFSAFIMVCSVFPYLPGQKENNKQEL